jgi:hypothetical protein
MKPALRSAVSTERFGTVTEPVPPPGAAPTHVEEERPTLTSSVPAGGDPTERYGTVPGPEIVPDDAPVVTRVPDARVAPAAPGSVRPPAGSGGPRRARRLLRAVMGGVELEPSSSSKATELDLVAVPHARGRFDPTLRLRQVASPSSRALILLGAGAIALLVVACAMLARQFSPRTEERPAVTAAPH